MSPGSAPSAVADADLDGALADDVGHDAVDADGGEAERDARRRASSSVEPKRSRASDVATHCSIVRTSDTGWSLSIDWIAAFDHRCRRERVRVGADRERHARS